MYCLESVAAGQPHMSSVETAADLMTPNPRCIRASATIVEAVRILTDRGISAAPVIDDLGRPVGVVSQTDIIIHQRESSDRSGATADYFQEPELAGASVGQWAAGSSRGDDCMRVRDIMTPTVFTVAPDVPARQVVEYMLALMVHRLFVIGGDGKLIGVISALDVLRRLHWGNGAD